MCSSIRILAPVLWNSSLSVCPLSLRFHTIGRRLIGPRSTEREGKCRGQEFHSAANERTNCCGHFYSSSHDLNIDSFQKGKFIQSWLGLSILYCSFWVKYLGTTPGNLHVEMCVLRCFEGNLRLFCFSQVWELAARQQALNEHNFIVTVLWIWNCKFSVDICSAQFLPCMSLSPPPL